jgi:hypothetical protein
MQKRRKKIHDYSYDDGEEIIPDGHTLRVL